MNRVESILTTSFQTTSEAGVGERFRRLSAEWKVQSRYLSNTAQMAMLKPYQRIVGMGFSAVPLILEELRRKPDQWFWALEAITEDNPVPPEAAGKVREMARAWIDWGTRRGLLIHDRWTRLSFPDSGEPSGHQSAFG